MWKLFHRKKKPIHHLSNAPPPDWVGGEVSLENPDRTEPASMPEQDLPPDSTATGAVAVVGPEQLNALAKLISKRLAPLMDHQAQNVAHHTTKMTLDSHARLAEQINTAVEQINENVATRISAEATGLQHTVEQQLDPLADRLQACLAKSTADHWFAIAGQLEEACSATTQRATLRPVIDQLLALQDRIGDERAFLTAWYRREPELGMHLGCRQMFERYDSAVQSFVTEIYMILGSLDVHPLNGCAGPFNSQQQKIVGLEATTNPELDGHVARVVRPGFTWAGTVLRPEQISVFKMEKQR